MSTLFPQASSSNGTSRERDCNAYGSILHIEFSFHYNRDYTKVGLG